MAHQWQKDFCSSVKNRFPEYFKNKKILDCGSLNINGDNRYLFENCNYIGIDLGEGKNVDIISPIHLFNEVDQSYDTIISTECFEHDMFYVESLKNICRLLKSKGLFLFTCASGLRPEHGTEKTGSEKDSPFTSTNSIEEWKNYYKNLEIEDIKNAINVDEIFDTYEFSKNGGQDDLYFWGIKK